MPMSAHLAIKNCRVVLPHGVFNGGVAISDGKISKIASDSQLPSDAVDGKERYLLPGAIDSHVHFREPGYEYKEDFSTGSMAAAAGGVTTVIDMPSGIPYIDSVENLKKKFALIAGRSSVDYGQNCMIADYNLDELEGMIKAGAIGFKLYMSKTAVKVSIPSDGAIFEAFSRLAKIGATTSVHAENDSIISFYMEKVKNEGRKDISAYAEGRPRLAEAEAIQRIAIFSSYAGNKIHILHLTSKDGLEQVVRWKQTGVKITVETCPQYLLLGNKQLEKLGSIARINPPIRGDDEIPALWEGINNGQIDTLGSDHSPHKLEEKYKEDVWEAASGFNGVETLVPLMLTEVHTGRISIERYVKLVSENPAKIFGLYPKKGVIEIGSDADLILVDFKESVIKSDRLKSKTKVTPFDGWRVRGIPSICFLRGEKIMEDGEVIGRPSGKMVRELG
jgi:dihydroorotase